ncbi:c-type cytochrome biogenesis protein CcsB [Selenihalanaerobacter shriftii]|uniref:Cytochrome c-type biogenesis protein CcsB n=1 Tax=Selenihalanaerobacter shriftii TaxID=142842 RepID=A0A1T4MJ16_9FIRM|nr:c-type cytochrome biogenesis protein CcsB [Selenihalanaerobacter shriftii]SJZ66748.1 cytochrome c-type biogenesis protein CcsB [Selenihalanaerobacter shriftii]
MDWSQILFKITLIIYLFSGGFYIKREFFSNPKSPNHWTSNLLYVGIGTHTLSLLILILQTGYLPIKNFYETLLLITWTIIIIYMLIEYLYKVRVLGAFIIPFNSLVLLYASFLPNEIDNLPAEIHSIWLDIHTSAIFISYGVFTLAFCISVAYLLQEKQLNDKTPSRFYYRLPSLNKLDKLSYQLIMIGFPLLTTGIITGSLWANQVWGMYWNWNAKQVWTGIVWLIYAIYLYNRARNNLSKKNSAYITVIGFLTILITYLGLTFISSSLHNFT